jgi:DNA ligase-1
VRTFAALYRRLDQSNATRDKLAVLRDYFAREPAADAAWGLHYLCGGRVRRLVSTRILREAALARSGLPPWLFEECYAAVGDLAETVALVLEDAAERPQTEHDAAPGGRPSAWDDPGLDRWMREHLLPIADLPHEQAVRSILECWTRLDRDQRFVFNKLITGGLRVGVSRQLVIRALAEACGVEPGLIAQRLVGFAEGGRLPNAEGFAAVCDGSEASPAGAEAREGQPVRAHAGLLPYPFQLAHVLTPEEASTLDPTACLFEWKWDGIRAQLIREDDRVAIWSRGEELITDRFPEVAEQALACLPAGLTLDGELLCWQPDAQAPMPFAVLQTRIGRKRPGAKTLSAAPARFVAFDCLREGGRDLRAHALSDRRDLLERLGQDRGGGPALSLVQPMRFASWEAAQAYRARARELGAEGLMVKHLDARHAMGRIRSPDRAHWWKWKLDARTVDAVLVYAQPGHGRRAGLYTDYTFALWDEGKEPRRLVPFAKAYSGLSDQEIKAVDAIIRRSTVERFGPVRALEPRLVFEIAFEGIQASKRHKAGLAVRFPRILRWRTDKEATQADSLERLLEMLESKAPDRSAE